MLSLPTPIIKVTVCCSRGRFVSNRCRRLLHHCTSAQDFDYGALVGLERFSINNLGDPFIESNYGVHSREFEVGSSRLKHMRASGCCGA